MERSNISSPAQWRSPNTWQITLGQLETLLKSARLAHAQLDWNFLSNVDEESKGNNIKTQKHELPYSFEPYPSPR